jgi:hypothetical protein
MSSRQYVIDVPGYANLRSRYYTVAGYTVAGDDIIYDRPRSDGLL